MVIVGNVERISVPVALKI